MKNFTISLLTLIVPALFSGERTAPKLELDKVKNGIVFFTFDDRNFKGWEQALPLFEKYDAYATFLIHGYIDRNIVKYIRLLRKNGHAVGLHSLRHKNAPEFIEKFGKEKYLEAEIHPQLEACKKAGLEMKFFAYPNNRRTPETDAVLGKYFQRFRAGCKKPKNVSLLNYKPFFRTIEELKKSPVMPGAGIGSYYKTTPDLLRKVLAKAAKENKVIVFFSHDIAPKANSISMDTAILELCLKEAKKLKMLVASFDQIPE